MNRKKKIILGASLGLTLVIGTTMAFYPMVVGIVAEKFINKIMQSTQEKSKGNKEFNYNISYCSNNIFI